MHCPNCKSHNLARSRTKTVIEKANRTILGNKYYRCVNCKWRGTIRHKTRFRWERALLIAVYLIVLAFVVRSCMTQSPGSRSGTADSSLSGRRP